MRRRMATLIAGPHVAATTVGVHDGVGRPARKLRPWEVITDRYHFQPVTSTELITYLGVASCVRLRPVLLAGDGFGVKMVVVTSADAQGDPSVDPDIRGDHRRAA